MNGKEIHLRLSRDGRLVESCKCVKDSDLWNPDPRFATGLTVTRETRTLIEQIEQISSDHIGWYPLCRREQGDIQRRQRDTICRALLILFFAYVFAYVV
jgi:hypothetical protein